MLLHGIFVLFVAVLAVNLGLVAFWAVLGVVRYLQSRKNMVD